MLNSFVLEKVLEKGQKNKAIYYEMALYQWQGQKDLNPRHAVLERLLKLKKADNKAVLKPFLHPLQNNKNILMLY